MIERYYVTPENVNRFGGNGKVIYTPVVVVKEPDIAHIYMAGRTSRNLDGSVSCVGDMRGQLREVCKAIEQSLAAVGATLADVVRTTTYTTDVEAYFAVSDERFRYFREPLPTSTLIGVARLARPEMLVEIEAEAVLDPARLTIPKDAVRR